MKKMLALLLCLTLMNNHIFAQSETRLLRFPAIHGNQIVFSYAGNLYTATAHGGIARKLTSDIGYESFARFSSDGTQIAFTGQYDGNTEVYLMPAKGGIPKRLTYTATLGRDNIWDRMGPNNLVMGWKHDHKTIVFRSRKNSFNSFKGALFTVDTAGNLPLQLPFSTGGFCSFSPDDSKLAYNRIFREFRTWKYYRGGMADDVWVYDFKTGITENISNNPAQDIEPMWAGNKIYYISDRDEIMNLFVYDLQTKETRKLTHFTKYDIKWPSLGDNAIIFENAGYLYTYDLQSGKLTQLHIYIDDDFNVGRNFLADASKSINDATLSPDGKRVIFNARGELFTLPAETGITRNLTQTSGVHERNATWSPDGQWIAYISDRSGEDEIYIRDEKGTKDMQLTKNAETYKWELKWSPDSKKIMWGDKMLRLRYIDINSKKITEIAQNTVWEYRNYNWSPDSKWVTYSGQTKQGLTTVYLYSLEKKGIYPVTEGWYSSSGASFSADGKYLVFISDRDFNPIYSWTEWNHAYKNMSKVYLATLSATTANPLNPLPDEVSTEIDLTDAKKDKSKTPVEMKMDPEGISGRIIALPIKAGAYGNAQAVAGGIYYMKRGDDHQTNLMYFDLKKREEKDLGKLDGFELSANGKKMLLTLKKKYAVIDLPHAKVEMKKTIDVSGMKVWVDRKAEWAEIFREGWRQMRDFYYDPNMHGLNWEDIGKKYEVLLPYVNHRADLTYIMGEMISELNTGHSYVGGGDVPKPERIKTGLLGAQLSKDPSTGYFRINHILAGENWSKNTRSPLTEIGIDVHQDDYILAVNGKATSAVNNIYQLLVGKAGQEVELTVNNEATFDGAHNIVVKPIADESSLYYYNWVQNNIRKVNEASAGQIGYLHIPDMGREGLNEFVKHFYPQINKRALIIDVRGNGGGNVSPMIIERLNRALVMLDIARNTAPYQNPEDMLVGPKVTLIDPWSASDGDIFPYRFKTLKMGKLIGQRSWGGVVGIRGPLPLVDGGYLYKPEFAPYDTKGKKWVIEGHGVDPDIVVVNDPAKEFAGQDDQLDKAIEVILEALKNYPETLPGPPPFKGKNE